MEIKPEHSDRLERALREANLEYWEGFAKYFPEAKTGDFPPDLTFNRYAHNKEDVLWWLQYNAPELLVGYQAPEHLPILYTVHFEDGSSVTETGTVGGLSDKYPTAIDIREAG